MYNRTLSSVYRSVEPLDLVKLPFQGKCKFVLVTPEFETPTREMRAALPSEVPFKSMISNNVAGGSLVCFLASSAPAAC